MEATLQRQRQGKSWLTTTPWAQFHKDPKFYVKYDAVYLALIVVAFAILFFVEYRAPQLVWSWSNALLIVPITYFLILFHAYVHNAVHGSFPKSVNRIVGEVLGVMIWTRFASWEMVHKRHHRYSDDPIKDPHPAIREFWTYAGRMIVSVEKQLQMEYYDTYGDGKAQRGYETWRAIFSFVTGMSLIGLFYVVLGPVLFVLMLLGELLAGLFVIHFNWAGHNGHRPNEPLIPTDLDYGVYWIGNRIFPGIYYHGTHHKYSMLFNPMKWKKSKEAQEKLKLGNKSEDESFLKGRDEEGSAHN